MITTTSATDETTTTEKLHVYRDMIPSRGYYHNPLIHCQKINVLYDRPSLHVHTIGKRVL